jgi:phage terminase large subunit-like protein
MATKVLKKLSKLHPAEQYADDVIAGRIPACKNIIKACERYVNDKKNAKKLGIEFRPHAAQAYIDLIEIFPLTKGKDAGKPLKLEPWQQFIVWNVYGWYNVATGYRRFTKATISVPKKNGKTELIAAIANAHLILDNEYGAEIYMAATARDQAKICFKAAKTMVELCPPLQEYLQPLKTGIFYGKNNSSIKYISSEAGTIEGGGASLVVYDEEHEQVDTELKDNLMTGQAAKVDPLFFSISTSGLDKTKPYYQHVRDSEKVLHGIVNEPDHFILLYGLDEGDDWRTVESLQKANPNWGVSVVPHTVIAAQQEAISKPSKQVSFKVKHLNVWTDTAKTWISHDTWMKNETKGVKLEDFAGKPVWLGLDLARSADFSALSILVPHESGKEFTCFWKFYIPSESADERTKRDNINIKLWEQQGYITITDGNVADYDYIERDIMQIFKKFTVRSLAYDPAMSSQLVTSLSGQGVPVSKYVQGIMNMSPPSKEFEKLVLGQKFHHNNNPVMNWMLSNVYLYVDANENIKPHRGKSSNKIDGVVSALNALGEYMTDTAETQQKTNNVGIREF